MENQEKKRLFIALKLPDDIIADITDLINKLTKQNKSRAVKWVKPDGIHLTLHFLGYLDVQLENQIKLIMQSFQGKFGELQFKLGKINAFPNLSRPRVIYLGCKQVDSKSVFKLQELLGEKLIQLRIKVDRRHWKPHLTLGRVKDVGTFQVPPDLINFDFNKIFTVNLFELIESKLKPDGAEYKEVISYKL